MNISLIVAVDEKNGIGKNNTIPWNIPNDMKHFKDITIGNGNNVVIMGRITWESIPSKFKPLQDRVNLIVSKSSKFKTLDDAIKYAQSLDNIEEIFVIGGEMLYKEAMKFSISDSQKLCNKIYITRIYHDYECDKFFPIIRDDFKLIEYSIVYDTTKGSIMYETKDHIKYRYEVYAIL